MIYEVKFKIPVSEIDIHYRHVLYTNINNDNAVGIFYNNNNNIYIYI